MITSMGGGTQPQRLSPGVYSMNGQTVHSARPPVLPVSTPKPVVKPPVTTAVTAPVTKPVTPSNSMTTGLSPTPVPTDGSVGGNAAAFETSLRSQLGTLKPNTPEYFRQRAMLNDYLEREGKPVNRLPGEAPYAGTTFTPANGFNGVGATTSTGAPVDPPPPGGAPTPDPFKSIYDFALKNYQDSPVFKWQQQLMNEELNKRLAAQGYNNSGANNEAAVRGLNDLSGQWYDRILNTAGQDATRYDNMQSQAADAQQHTNDERLNTALTLLQSLLGQNPINQATSGLSDYNSIIGQIGGLLGDIKANGFKVATPKVVAPGSAGAPPSTVVSNPGPDLNGVNLAGVASNASSGANWTNLVQNIISSIL